MDPTDRQPPDEATELAVPPTEAEPGRRATPRIAGEPEPGDLVGPWRLLEEIGTGGMGRVFRARRADGAYQRLVALKLLHRGVGDLHREGRFRSEQQILASLEHPGIARLYDAGVTTEGRPWIAMELVAGPDIVEHCASEGLGVEARARLVERVCEAVGHAHARGIVHRDLKPSNILVAPGDGGGETRPVVVDFGIARTLGQPGTTRTGQAVGTPAYMSPEQARGIEVDRRTDVYALGAVLYRLLAGRPPWSGEGGLEVMLQVVHDEPPAVRSVAPQVPRDLETIVMKCLERDPDRRYDSTRALAEDLRRYLAGEPLAARPAGLLYQLGKRARKRPAAAALLALLAVGLPLGLLKYTLDLRGERSRALAARGDAERVMEFLLQDVYQGLEPLGRLDLLERVAGEALDYYRHQPLAELAPDALHRRSSSLRNVGVVLATRGKWDDSLPIYEELHELAARMARQEPADPFWRLELVRSLWLLGEAHEAQGSVQTASSYYQRAADEARSVTRRWPGHPEARAQLWKALTMAGVNRLDQRELDAAGRCFAEALAVAEARLAATPAPHVDRDAAVADMAETRGLLGLLQREQGNPGAAVAHFTAALGLIRGLVERAPARAPWRGRLQLTLNHLASTLLQQGDGERALELFAESIATGELLVSQVPAYAGWARELAVAHSETAYLLRERGELRGALRHMERSLAISRDLAARDPTSQWARADLAWDLLELGRVRAQLDAGATRDATELWEEALAMIEPVTSATRQVYHLNTHAQLLLELDREEAARPLLAQLRAEGWTDPDLDALLRRHHLEPLGGVP
jgi:tetratricopeptide (TPR) repeat protein